MDDDTIDLVRQLLCRAGMAMEDVVHIAVVSPRDTETLREAAEVIHAALKRCKRLADAAVGLLEM